MAYKIKEASEEEINMLLVASEEVYAKMKKDAVESKKELPEEPTATKIKRIVNQTRSEKLNNAINMISLYGGSRKLPVKAVDIMPIITQENYKENDEKDIAVRV